MKRNAQICYKRDEMRRGKGQDEEMRLKGTRKYGEEKSEETGCVDEMKRNAKIYYKRDEIRRVKRQDEEMR
jgi:hypothetical protein